MGKDIDFYITGVRYTSDGNEIASVKVQLRLEPITGGSKVSNNSRVVNRGFIYDLLLTDKIVFYTATKDKNGWHCGAEVIIYGDKYITTSSNQTEKDNLENIPEF